jgi:hypothetical protein
VPIPHLIRFDDLPIPGLETQMTRHLSLTFPWWFIENTKKETKIQGNGKSVRSSSMKSKAWDGPGNSNIFILFSKGFWICWVDRSLIL